MLCYWALRKDLGHESTLNRQVGTFMVRVLNTIERAKTRETVRLPGLSQAS